MSEIASERLNYLSKKQRAVSSRQQRQIIPCSNGVTFSCGQTARIDIGGNQMASYLDFQNSYLKLTINNGDSSAILLESAYALLDKLEIMADGATISSISNYGAVVHSYLDSEVGSNWKDNFGRGLAGTSFNYDEMVKITAGGKATYCLPLVLCPLFCNKYIPCMGRSTLSIRITFASAAKGTVGGATDSEIVMNPVEFIGSFVKLSAEANALVIANTGGRFEIITSDIRCSEHNVASGDNVLAKNLGFSFSSLDRVCFGFYPTLTTAATVSVGNRASGDVAEFAISINGSEHPAKRIQVGADMSETFAEIGVASRSLADFNHQSSLNPYFIDTTSSVNTYTARFLMANPSGGPETTDGEDYDANTGKAMYMLDTESMRPHSDPESLYSGVSTLGSVVQLVGTLNSATVASTLLVHAQYTLAMTLDLNGSQTWVVSI